MKRTAIPALAVVGTLMTGWTLNGLSAQQRPACLHGASETPADAGRRADAIRVIRAINTAQAQAFGNVRRYQSFGELTRTGLPSRPEGFLTQLTVESSAYAVMVTDTRDPCGYTLFSDQDGLI